MCGGVAIWRRSALSLNFWGLVVGGYWNRMDDSGAGWMRPWLPEWGWGWLRPGLARSMVVVTQLLSKVSQRMWKVHMTGLCCMLYRVGPFPAFSVLVRISQLIFILSLTPLTLSFFPLSACPFTLLAFFLPFSLPSPSLLSVWPWYYSVILCCQFKYRL